MSRGRRWLPGTLHQIQVLAAAGRVRLTRKSRSELHTLDLGLIEADVPDILIALSSSDFAGRTVSKLDGEWMYCFKPSICGTQVYIKVVIRDTCLVVSFHEDRNP